MSDNGSVSSGLKDLAKESIKQITQVPGSIIKGAGNQVLSTESKEAEEKKKMEQMMTFQRIKEIEAEMEQLRREDEQKKGPEVVSSKEQSQNNNVTFGKQKKVDEASRQALGRAEQGRNFKG